VRVDPQLVITDRLTLRQPVPGDLPEVFRVHGDPATQRFNPDGPDLDLTASGRRLNEWLAHWSDHGFGYWTVCSSVDAEVIGFGGVRLEEWAGAPVLNLYYRLAPSAWGRGIATELARAAIALGRQVRPIYRCRHTPPLTTSRRSGRRRPSGWSAVRIWTGSRRATSRSSSGSLRRRRLRSAAGRHEGWGGWTRSG